MCAEGAWAQSLCMCAEVFLGRVVVYVTDG